MPRAIWRSPLGPVPPARGLFAIRSDSAAISISGRRADVGLRRVRVRNIIDRRQHPAKHLGFAKDSGRRWKSTKMHVAENRSPEKGKKEVAYANSPNGSRPARRALQCASSSKLRKKGGKFGYQPHNPSGSQKQTAVGRRVASISARFLFGGPGDLDYRWGGLRATFQIRPHVELQGSARGPV